MSNPTGTDCVLLTPLCSRELRQSPPCGAGRASVDEELEDDGLASDDDEGFDTIDSDSEDDEEEEDEMEFEEEDDLAAAEEEAEAAEEAVREVGRRSHCIYFSEYQ